MRFLFLARCFPPITFLISHSLLKICATADVFCHIKHATANQAALWSLTAAYRMPGSLLPRTPSGDVWLASHLTGIPLEQTTVFAPGSACASSSWQQPRRCLMSIPFTLYTYLQ